MYVEPLNVDVNTGLVVGATGASGSDCVVDEPAIRAKEPSGFIFIAIRIPPTSTALITIGRGVYTRSSWGFGFTIREHESVPISIFRQ